MKLIQVALTNGLVADQDLGMSSSTVQAVRLVNESNLYVYVSASGIEDYLAPWDDVSYQLPIGNIHLETSSLSPAPSPYSTLVIQVYSQAESIPARHSQPGQHRQLVRQASSSQVQLSLTANTGFSPPGLCSVQLPTKKNTTTYIHSFLATMANPPATPATIQAAPTNNVANINSIAYNIQEGQSLPSSVFFQYPQPIPASGKNTAITFSLTTGGSAQYSLYVWSFFQ